MSDFSQFTSLIQIRCQVIKLSHKTDIYTPFCRIFPSASLLFKHFTTEKVLFKHFTNGTFPLYYMGFLQEFPYFCEGSVLDGGPKDEGKCLLLWSHTCHEFCLIKANQIFSFQKPMN